MNTYDKLVLNHLRLMRFGSKQTVYFPTLFKKHLGKIPYDGNKGEVLELISDSVERLYTDIYKKELVYINQLSTEQINKIAIVFKGLFDKRLTKSEAKSVKNIARIGSEPLLDEGKSYFLNRWDMAQTKTTELLELTTLYPKSDRIEQAEIIIKRRAFDAKTLSLSTTNAVGNRLYLDTYQKNGIDKARINCTLDKRTCQRCAARCDMVVNVKDAQIVPIHMRCRCVMAPIIDGIPQPEMTYKKWFNRLDDDSQREILGEGRFKLFKDGKYKVDDFDDRLLSELL